MKILKITFAFFVVSFLSSTNTNAATLYWMGGEGNWNDPAHWSTNPISPRVSAGTAPVSTDDVVVDSISGAGTYTIHINSTARCKNINVFLLGGDNIVVDNSNGTADSLIVSGSMKLLSTDDLFQWNYNGIVVFNSPTPNTTVNTYGQVFGTTIFNGTGLWNVNSNFSLGFNQNLLIKQGVANFFGFIENLPGYADLRIEGGTMNVNGYLTTVTFDSILVKGNGTFYVNTISYATCTNLYIGENGKMFINSTKTGLDNTYVQVNSNLVLEGGSLNLAGKNLFLKQQPEIHILAGTISSDASTIYCNKFFIEGSGIKNLSFNNGTRIDVNTAWITSGSSNVNLSGNYDIRTVDPSLTNVNFGFQGGGYVYSNLIIPPLWTCTITGACSFNDIEMESISGQNSSLILADNNIGVNSIRSASADGLGINYISSTGKTINDLNGGKNCMRNFNINGTHASGANFFIYNSTVTSGNNWSIAAGSFPSTNGILPNYEPICPGTAITVSPNITSITGPSLTYQWSANSLIISTQLTAISYTPAATTTFFLKTEDTSTGCFTTDSFLVNIMGPQTIPNAGPDAVICSGNNIVLIGKSVPAWLRYVWTPSNSLTGGSPSPGEFNEGDGEVQVTASPTTTTTYTLQTEFYDMATSSYCSGYDYITVTVDNFSITAVSPAAPAICIGDSITLVASGALIYNWETFPGAIPLNNDSMHVKPMITTTFTVNGCTSSRAVTVTVNPLPTVNAGSDASVCQGLSYTLSASGASVYEWMPATGLSGSTGANPSVLPASTTKYFVRGVDVNNCINKDSIMIFVNPLPANIEAGMNASVCLGASAALTASGGVNYTWSPAAGLSATDISNPVASPVVKTVYYVTGYDANKCSDKDSVTVYIKPGSISGTVSYSGGTLNGNAYAKLYKYAIFSEMLMLDSTGIDANGMYVFNNLAYTDSFIVYAQGDTLSYPNTAGTYYDNTFDWNNADKLFATCPATSANISLVEMSTETGSNTVSGKIVEGEGFGKTEAAGDGIEGVQVGLKKKPGGQLSGIAMTDSNGDYEIGNVPDGTYEMYINIPGLPMIDNYTITLSSGNPEETRMDFEVDSNKIETTILTSVKKIAGENSVIRIFPNPAKDVLYISVESSSPDNLTIEFVDVVGKKIKSSYNNQVVRGVSFFQLNTSDLPGGIYWINLQTEDRATTKKLCIIR